MKELLRILALLAQKKEYLLLFERESEAICRVPAEELVTRVEARQAIIDALKILDQELDSLCVDAGEAAQAAMKNTCNRAGLPQEEAKIYDASMQVRGVAGRILENNSMVRDRLEQERATALENLERITASQLAAASRYSPTITTDGRNPLYSRELGRI